MTRQMTENDRFYAIGQRQKTTDTESQYRQKNDRYSSR